MYNVNKKKNKNYKIYKNIKKSEKKNYLICISLGVDSKFAKNLILETIINKIKNIYINHNLKEEKNKKILKNIKKNKFLICKIKKSKNNIEKILKKKRFKKIKNVCIKNKIKNI